MSLRVVEPASPERRRRRLRSPAATEERFDVTGLYRNLAPAVLGYFRSQSAPDPEDLLGETFLGVVRDIGRFRGDEDALRRWVFTVAHHRLLDSRRRSGRRPVLTGGPVPEPVAAAAPEPFDPQLVEALAALTADQRDVVTLRFVADLPVDAVASLTGRSTGAVKALQHRALDALARELGPGWSPVSAAEA